MSFYVTKTVMVGAKWFWSDQIDLDLTKMIWSRPKWNGRDQNELVATKMNWSGLKKFLEPAMFCHLAVLKDEGLKLWLPIGLAQKANWAVFSHYCSKDISCSNRQIVFFVIEIKTVTENWDSKTPSVETIFAYLARFLNWCSESKMSCFFSLLLKKHKLLKP